MNEQRADVTWDGLKHSYIPDGTTASPLVPFCDAWEDELDPVTFEVVRHALWNVNIEHGEAIIRVSGSPQAVFAQDFNPALFTAEGEYVFTGPYIQVQASVVDLVIKWILEHRAENPGIGPGDMFLCNDPWIGAHHQEDVVIAAPIFWEGKLLCWTANVLHQQDLGGSTPGGYCPDARDAFDEPGCIPPIKIVENGRIRRDLEDEYRRRSRQPQLLALDLRATIAGANVTRRRIEGLAARYGPGVLRASFEKVIADAAGVVGDRLARLPDGEWKAEAFIECRAPGDRGLYRGELTAIKRGRTLVFTDRGTDPQIGNINTTYSAWRSAILAAFSPVMCFDLLYAVGGALRCVGFDPEPGTITSANFPAAVSNTSGGALMSFNLATTCLGKMLAFDPELRAEVFAGGANCAWPLTLMGGTDPSGNVFATVQLDAMGGGYGAFSWRDGTNTAGMVWAPMSPMPNVEFTEQLFPVLYLYRREDVDSGGAGRFRGGAAGAFALTNHGATDTWFATSTSGVGVPTAQGLAGGLPGPATRITMADATDLRARMATGEMPATIEAVGGDARPLQPKDPHVPMPDDSVVEVAWSGPGGYGDPLEREPEAVLEDVVGGYVSVEAAERLYAVVVGAAAGPDADDVAGPGVGPGAGLALDLEATARLRADAYAARRAAPGPNAETLADDWAQVAESTTLGVYEHDGDHHFGCLRCRADLGPVDGAYKRRCRQIELAPRTLGDFYPDQPLFVDGTINLRQVVCPGCERLLDSELFRAGDEPLQDIALTRVVAAEAREAMSG